MRSLSSLSLFFLNASCRQSSRLLQLWCSGRRCCRGETSQNHTALMGWMYGELTVEQNCDEQCGQVPTRRSAAELHCEAVPSWNWQRFLAGMVVV